MILASMLFRLLSNDNLTVSTHRAKEVNRRLAPGTLQRSVLRAVF